MTDFTEDHLIHGMSFVEEMLLEDELQHYGVKGMKWGKRKSKVQRLERKIKRTKNSRIHPYKKSSLAVSKRRLEIAKLKEISKERPLTGSEKRRLQNHQMNLKVDRQIRARSRGQVAAAATLVGMHVKNTPAAKRATRVVKTGAAQSARRVYNTATDFKARKKNYSSGRYYNPDGSRAFVNPNFGGNVRVVG